jgi:hypothetical protein
VNETELEKKAATYFLGRLGKNGQTKCTHTKSQVKGLRLTQAEELLHQSCDQKTICIESISYLVFKIRFLEQGFGGLEVLEAG